MFSDDSEAEDVVNLTINEHYAKAYEYRKEREELAKLKEKYGSDVEEDQVSEEDSEEDESEDEDGEELTPAVDAAILRTLARIKRKDPSIYQQGKNVFEEEQQRTGDTAPSRRVLKDKSKPITMRQHALASALNPESRSPSPEPLTHVEEQAALRRETIAAFHTAIAEDDDDTLLVPRERTKDELEREEEEYRAFLEREVGEELKEIVTLDVQPVQEAEHKESDLKRDKKLQKKAAQAKESKEEADQEFLVNYILNRGWIDRSARRLPTYQEITASLEKGKSKAGRKQSDSQGIISDEEAKEIVAGESQSEEIDEDEFDEVADRFESSYNFRFEEPGASTIARHPRNLPSLVRREDSSRKEAREKRKARKEEELLRKREEVKRLKALKMKDLRAKLEKIGKEGGTNFHESKALQDLDLEGDWDPGAHDRQMAELYEQEVDMEVVDEEKPHWDDDIDITDIFPLDEYDGAGSSRKSKKKKRKSNNADEMEAGVDVDEMDANVQKALEDEDWDGTEEMRKRKLDEYMDELYGMEFNDMVGDMPTRFKYAPVAPQTYGLTPTEILLATDAELNSYVGIKKYAPYRKDGKGKQWDNTRNDRLQELRGKLRERGIDSTGGGADAKGEKGKKRKGKKERMRERIASVITTENHKNPDGDIEDEDEQKAKQLRGNDADRFELGEADEPSKKKRRRHKKSGKSQQEEN
ncbi:uncharacterized protein FIBRA_08122 [Fibroporia radiculosa]|uniref:Kri1-like C-terminal domain-containing protein n=1 Tax=Fibroporia radiculosa TaxID=599839 RepID=J4GW93_9APHY|nr:uncharacterized protein FIBRA_08122 [Fibroporia radiculosa]CCM05885.1 predicted protein [Fibroporia radiculosa]